MSAKPERFHTGMPFIGRCLIGLGMGASLAFVLVRPIFGERDGERCILVPKANEVCNASYSLGSYFAEACIASVMVATLYVVWTYVADRRDD